MAGLKEVIAEKFPIDEFYDTQKSDREKATDCVRHALERAAKEGDEMVATYKSSNNLWQAESVARFVLRIRALLAERLTSE